MNAVTVVSFIAATAAVALATWLFVRRMRRADDPTVEFFTGGRALAWPVVAGSLLLTNLSTEQLVGLNGAVFKDGNLVGVAWEALAAFAMIATALLFLPRYLRSGFTTTPAFLEQRFDRPTRLLVSALFLFGYVTVLLPVVLYTGSLAIKTMFQLDVPLAAVVWGIGLLGSAYAIFGGLKAVAVSDTFNGIGLLIGGLAIPALGLAALGEGSITAGISTLVHARPESLAVLTTLDKKGGPVSVPWPTLLTGMMFIQVFY
ncbi:MAG: solute:sodium symporter family transporter, partial [Myxococcales bacterium]|nr:solute:sodium symporter family transporter [Myxococcales bacterium]